MLGNPPSWNIKWQDISQDFDGYFERWRLVYETSLEIIDNQVELKENISNFAVT